MCVCIYIFLFWTWFFSVFFFVTLLNVSEDKTIKLWKISERDKRAEGYNLKDEDGRLRDPFRITALRVSRVSPYAASFSVHLLEDCW